MMKRRSQLLSIFVLFILLLFYSANSQIDIEQDSGNKRSQDILHKSMGTRVAGIAHDAIIIGSDEEFTTKAAEENWLGDGSITTPFIIEGFDIDVGGLGGNCIKVENTTVYFIIQNCYLTGSGDAGVRLGNLTNGVVRNNDFVSNSRGIAGNANYTTISENFINCTGASRCIEMSQTYYCKFVGNELIGSNYGVRLSSSPFNEIMNNTIIPEWAGGIYLSVSDNCTIRGNEVSKATIAGIDLFWCDNAVLQDNLVFDCSMGIQLDTCPYSKILSSTVRDNFEGMVLTYSSESLVMYCTIQNNSLTGLELDTGNLVVVSWNEFRSNNAHVLDAATDSVIDANYYDDYTGSDLNGDGFGEEPYVIPPLSSLDIHPLVFTPTPVVWSHALSNQFVELGNDFVYDLDVTSSAPIYQWTVSPGQYFVIDNEGIIRDRGDLEVGIYNLDVTVTNIYGLGAEGSFSVTVVDTINPEWITAARNRTYNYGSSIEFQVGAWDPAGIENWTMSDNENFLLIEESYGETSLATIINTHILNVGEYQISLEAIDTNGNTASMVFTITIIATNAGQGTSSDLAFILSLAGIGVAAFALVIGLIAFMTSRRQIKSSK